LSGLAGNVLVEAMMTSLRDSIHNYVMAAVSLLDDWTTVATTLRYEHRAIVDAIRRGHRTTKAASLAVHTSKILSPHRCPINFLNVRIEGPRRADQQSRDASYRRVVATVVQSREANTAAIT